jgi:hypothetical protein
MSARDSHEQQTDPRDTQGPSRPSHEDSADDAQLSDEGQEEVHQMVEAYEDKPTVTLAGSHGTISGTAINEWIDDEGSPKFGDPDEHPFADDESPGDDPKQTASDGA